MGIFSETNLNYVLRAIASGLRYPVIALLLALMAAALVLAGSIIAELVTERRHLKVKMPALVDALRNAESTVAETIAASGLLKRQKAVLTELTLHPELTADMRQALAVRLLEEEQARYERILSLSDTIAKLGPMLGLLGTLIPLGPGIIALGQGDT